jgi:hypothetical protein
MNAILKKEIEKTFDVLTQLESVELNPFFKHKVLQQTVKELEVNQPFFSWFMPQYQLAILSIVLLLNVGTIFYAFSNASDTDITDINTFAKEYSLQSSTNSILN